MNFPESCVLYLRSGSTTPDTLRVKINIPDKGFFLYEAKVIKIQDYTKDTIFQKKLLFFLPFYIMRYEKNLKEISQNSEKLVSLLKEYEEIRTGLEKELIQSNQSVLYTDLINLIIKISDYILRDDEKLQKGVDKIMGGQILELESERLLRIGKAEGMAMGKAEGMAMGKAEGMAMGRAEGEFIFAQLMTKLFAAGRTADAELAAKDENARKKFYLEFEEFD